jgi:50S ribosomal protein L16 3-hydroxylase
MWSLGSNVSKESFLTESWRKKAYSFDAHINIEDISAFLSKETLLKLCDNALVESRLVDGTDFSLELGPFKLDHLPTDQMLMIQGLESHLTDISRLISQHFSFLPRWRIDDVMATYANKETSCGAHFDHYDVFLIQIRGEKRWQLDDGEHLDSDLNENADIRLLDNFQSTTELIQKPGDILYIPPKVGHWGIASDDCLTLSIGIRNPTLQEMISHFADLIGDQLGEVHTMDDSLNMLDHGIDEKTTDSIADQMAINLLQPSLTRQWFGRYMTELREPELSKIPSKSMTIDQMKRMLKQALPIQCQLSSRLAYQELQESLLIFVNGECFVADKSSLVWFRELEQQRVIHPEKIPLQPADLNLLQTLFNIGILAAPPSELRVI